MKVLNVYGVLCLILVLCICACDSEMIGVKDNVKTTQMNFSEYVCTKPKECLPKVKINGDARSLEVTWYGDVYCDHSFLLTCKEKGGELIYRNEVVGNNGSWIFTFPYTEDYTIEYTIACLDPMPGCQHECKGEGLFRKEVGEERGDMAGVNECFKEYYYYSTRSESLTGTVILERNVNYGDDPDFMDIDRLTVYREGAMSDSWVEIYSDTLAPVSKGIYRISDLPCQVGINYQARLTSSKCEYSKDEHYLYFSYYSINGSPMIMSLERVNNH